MAHPCSSPRPPAWCTRKRKKRSTHSCSCPSGFERRGIMCHRGRTTKRATCRKRTR